MKRPACLLVALALLLGGCRSPQGDVPGQIAALHERMDAVDSGLEQLWEALDALEDSGEPLGSAEEDGSPEDGYSIYLTIDLLPGGETVYFGPYELKEGDRISLSLTAGGEADFSAGFSRRRSTRDAYWITSNPNGTREIAQEILVEQLFGGSYYLWVQNLSAAPLEDIAGRFLAEPPG